MIGFESSGDFEKTESFLQKMFNLDPGRKAESFAKMGVDSLKAATPFNSGLTADSWTYEIVREGSGVSIWWKNTNVINGFNVAVGLRYGHGTRNGGYVVGRNYITPALESTFKKIADAVWEEVRNT